MDKGGNLYMKSTGIVRKIDDLGRMVIPVELRKKMDNICSDISNNLIENNSELKLLRG